MRDATPRARRVLLDLGDQRFDYAAGQAVLIAPHGDERLRPYSIAAAPEDAIRYRALELLVGTDPSDPAEPHFVPAPGDLVDVQGPIGTFTFPAEPRERRFLFIAGGTGIAPLRAMLRHALRIPHREVALLYSARTPGDFAYEEEFRQLAHAGLIDFRQTVTRALRSEWSGARGRIDRSTLSDMLHDADTLCFVCGPQTLVQEVRALLEALGILPQRIMVDAA